MKLGVNIDHVATLRQARGGEQPDPAQAAKICEKAGAHSVVMHLREDRRHVQDADLYRVQEAVSIRLNLEMSIAPPIVKIAKKLQPHQATFVPEKRLERTTEGGLDLFQKTEKIARCIRTLQEREIQVSLFIDPDRRQIAAAKQLGADAVEFHTGDYADQKSSSGARREIERLKKAVAYAGEFGITAHAGHGLDYENVRALTNIKGLVEFNIGYSIVTRALWVGLEEAVREMRRLIEQ